MAQNKPLIIIDLDGTILDTTNRWYALHSDMCASAGLKPLERDAYITKKRDGVAEEVIMEDAGWERQNLQTYLQKRFDHIEDEKYLSLDSLKAGAQQALEILTTDYTLILVTKRRNENSCRHQINELGIERYFHNVLITAGREKQDLLQKQGVAPGTAYAVIGDTEADHELAQKLNSRCLLVADGARSRLYLSGLVGKSSIYPDLLTLAQAMV